MFVREERRDRDGSGRLQPFCLRQLPRSRRERPRQVCVKVTLSEKVGSAATLISWGECLCIALESKRHYYLSDPAKSKAEKAVLLFQV